MSWVTSVYQNVFRRTSTFALSILVGAFAFERVFDQGADYIFEVKNQGVGIDETMFCHF